RQQAGRAGGADEPAPTTGEHPGHGGPGRVHVRHEVDVPCALPCLVARVEPAAGADARVRDEDVEAAVALLGRRDEVGDGRPVGHVDVLCDGRDRWVRAIDVRGDVTGGGAVPVDHDHDGRPG